MRPYVTHAASNVQGGVACNLGRRTLVVGRSATGKSALLRAIELAGSGVADDVMGREQVAKEGMLLSLAPTGADGKPAELMAAIRLSDGSESSFKIPLSRTGGAKRAERTGREIAFPLRRLRDALCGTPETGQKFLLQHAVGALAEKDVLADLSPSSHRYWHAATARCKPGDDAITRVLVAIDKAKSEARAAKSKAGGSEAAAGEVAQGLAPPPTSQELTDADDQVGRAKAGLEEAVAASIRADHARRAAETSAKQIEEAARAHEKLPQLHAQIGPLREQLAQSRLYAENQRAFIAQAGGQLGTLVLPPLDPAWERLSASVEDHERRESAAGGSSIECSTCGSVVAAGSFHSRAEYLRGLLAQRRAQESQIAAQRQPLETGLARARRDLAAVESWLANAVLAEAQLAAEIKIAEQSVQIARVLGGLESGDSTSGEPGQSQLPLSQKLTVPDARAALKAAEDRFGALREAAVAWQTSRKAMDNASESTGEARQWSDLAVALERFVETRVNAAARLFVERVQRHLPPGDKFFLRPTEGRWGLLGPNGEERSALSGGEWVRATIALAAVCAPPDDTAPVLIVGEDRSIDPDTLARIMRAVSESELDAQVILQSGFGPADIPEGWTIMGWTIIRTDLGEHRVALAQVPQAAASKAPQAAASKAPQAPKAAQASKASQAPQGDNPEITIPAPAPSYSTPGVPEVAVELRLFEG